jgi:DNA-binding LacI/PurR family transcriptional regulator
MLLKPFKMEKRISLADIARVTGFAVSTISMALRNDASISTPTRKKIEETARRLGYYPNPLLAALASKQFREKRTDGTPIAYIRLPERTRGDEFTTQHIFALQQAHARKLGYRLEVFNVGDFRDGAHATGVLFSQGFQGILLQTRFRLNMLPGMDWNRFSVVGWGESTAKSQDSTRSPLSRAIVDHFGTVVRAWEETRKRGYRKIGFVLFNLPESRIEDESRLGAALMCLQRIPPRLRISPFILGQLNDFISLRLARWVRRCRLDAVIGFNSFILWALKREGFRIPRDLGFTSLHNEVDAETPPRTKFRVSGMKEIRLKTMLAAVELLDQQIRHHQYGLPGEPRTVLIDSEWIEGETLPPKPGRSSPLRGGNRSILPA